MFISNAHLRFDTGELSRLLSRLNQEVGTDLDHGHRLVLHGVVLKLDPVFPQVLLDVALQLWKAADAGCVVQFYNKPAVCLPNWTYYCISDYVRYRRLYNKPKYLQQCIHDNK